jgi:5-methylcytosine-specific restriction endonuclease McrA
MTRKSFNKKQRAAVFESTGGVCYLCKGTIKVGEAWHIEHKLALSYGGDNEPENLAPAHVKCHAVKTASEAGPRAKADRLRAKHTGTWPKSKRPLKSRGFDSNRNLPREG